MIAKFACPVDLIKGFARIHRSYIINIKHVKSNQKNKVVIAEKKFQLVKVIKVHSSKELIYNSVA